MKQILCIFFCVLCAFNSVTEEVVEIDEETFNEEVLPNLSKPVVLDFCATWCGPCKQYSPIVERISIEYDGIVDFYKVDVDENADWVERLGIKSVPTTLIVYTSSGDYLRTEGVKSIGVLRKGINRALKLFNENQSE